MPAVARWVRRRRRGLREWCTAGAASCCSGCPGGGRAVRDGGHGIPWSALNEKRLRSGRLKCPHPTSARREERGGERGDDAGELGRGL
eukprot:scaffold85872_cov63-Phaeocystis_antarctica.AAC.1